MWEIIIDGDIRLETPETRRLGKPRSVRVSGVAATKQDAYKLVDRLCESLEIPNE